jgi:hypothetical protein
MCFVFFIARDRKSTDASEEKVALLSPTLKDLLISLVQITSPKHRSVQDALADDLGDTLIHFETESMYSLLTLAEVLHAILCEPSEGDFRLLI